MSISVCLIAKNEMKYLPTWLENVSLFADEIIVVDTGSTDGSLEFLDNYPSVRKEFFSWTDNFSEARNHAISLATKEWILVLDADETIERAEKLNFFLNKSVDGFVIRIRNYQPDDSMTIYEDSVALRLFRNHKGYYFSGSIQDEIMTSIVETNGRIQLAKGLVIHHHGYRSDIVQGDQSRRSRNIGLLRSALTKDPESVRLLYHLGLCYKKISPPKLEFYLRKALDLPWQDDSKVIVEQIHLRLAQHYLQMNEHHKTIVHAKKCLSLNSKNLIASSCLIVSLSVKGRIMEVLPYIDFAIQHGEGVLRNIEDFHRLKTLLQRSILP